MKKQTADLRTPSLDLLGALLAVGLIIPVTGFVCLKYWAWFVLPNFNAPNLSLVTMSGLALLVRAITVQSTKKSKHSTGKSFTMSVLFWGLMLLFGWLIHLCA